jgi:PAS domain S-box-containing protein
MAMNLFGGLLHPGLASVLDTAFDAVCVMDSNGTVTGWNSHAAVLFGWSSEEAIGHRLSELIIPPKLREAHESGLAHYLATGEGPVLDRRIEVTALNANGDEFPVELSITASEQFGDLLFIGFVRDISERQAVSERQQRLLQESDHRVKNMLAVVSAIARQTARAATSTEHFLDSFSKRLEALAEAHSLLAGRKWNDVALAALAEQVLAADVASGRARFNGPELVLLTAQVLGLSMILHELYTNAVKYGALCTDEGSIDLRWRSEDGEVTLVWAESGPPCPSNAPSSGFGQRMIELAVKSDLSGTIERDWKPDGLTATIRFPVAA